MNKWGQLTLVLISVLFTSYQKLVYGEPFFTADFLIFSLIAWLVGWQYDLARFYGKKARSSEESYKQLIDSLPEIVVIHSNSVILYANQAAVSAAGAKSKEEVIGLSIFDFIPAEYEERLRERIRLAMKEQKPLHNMEHKVKRLDQTTFFLEVSSQRIVFFGEEAVLSIGKDVSERKAQTERLLQKSEKLALLGQMAAGIAHEIRNPLTSIKGFVQLFKDQNQQKEYYDIVLSELDRINAIVGEFLVLAKPSAAVYSAQDVKELIRDVVTLFNNQSLLNNVQIFVEFDRDLPMISCEQNQLKQVLLNLLKNAIEAMPMGGIVEIRAMAKDDGKISIQVTDQGMGIPEDRIPTLGEPFYTTKEKGTGLGLMTSYKIIESHNGELVISSKVNEGTTIEIILPALTQEYIKST
ncbi:PAS domain S-box protein [Mesobacillus foraminis]|uniref:ATP-binding protein n=1 Tax=Mesobacillus foraminis TaxID=279826 RepID=UPI001BEC1812|nr:ATP-binding protein [Mesobacillus foraminis]MBT2757727.1 PAS domain S-box protein [Mesobacillus foraminis]